MCKQNDSTNCIFHVLWLAKCHSWSHIIFCWKVGVSCQTRIAGLKTKVGNYKLVSLQQITWTVKEFPAVCTGFSVKGYKGPINNNLHLHGLVMRLASNLSGEQKESFKISTCYMFSKHLKTQDNFPYLFCKTVVLSDIH